ncbi:vWA domain-containing protein [Heyndrickxia sp. NPDC080065]|uniref:vWA domain-containing protein n=1 Tax=Heyndrickxia sp. NPDC080065 TaxID=3390568 RepID=UPI003D014CF0
MKKLLGILLMVNLLLVGCNGEKVANKENDHPRKPEKGEATQKKAKDNWQSILNDIQLDSTKEALKDQKAGILIEDNTMEQETKDVPLFPTDMDSELKGKLTEQLESLTEETKDPEMLEKGLLYLLGSPYYKDVIEPVEAFKPGFKEPDLPEPEKTTKTEKVKAKSSKAIILLDASSSMLQNVGGKMKMEIAKDAVKRFAKTIGQSSDVSLIVYGHVGSSADKDMKKSCSAIEEKYTMGKYNEKTFVKAVNSFQAKGWTPLAGAIKKAKEMTKDYEADTTIYIVSDGAETCEGNPVKEAEAFASINSEYKVNIIGFDVDSKSEDQLKKVADAGKGKYYSANNPNDLNKTIETQWLPSPLDLAWAFTKAPGPWEIMEERKRFDALSGPLKNMISWENDRYTKAVQILEQEKWIDSETSSTLREWLSERNEQLRNIASQLVKEKYTEIDDRASEIGKKVTEWTDRMWKLRKESGKEW